MSAGPSSSKSAVASSSAASSSASAAKPSQDAGKSKAAVQADAPESNEERLKRTMRLYYNVFDLQTNVSSCLIGMIRQLAMLRTGARAANDRFVRLCTSITHNLILSILRHIQKRRGKRPAPAPAAESTEDKKKQDSSKTTEEQASKKQKKDDPEEDE